MDRILVLSHVPAFGEGIAAILSGSGFDVAQTVDAHLWLCGNHADAMVVVIDSCERAQSIQTVSVAYPGLVIVTLVQKLDLPHYRCALDGGAHAVIPWESSSSDIVQTMTAAMHGLTTLPTGIARELAHSSLDRDVQSPAAAEELGWLRELARGGSVVALARRVGYSQREVYRRLALLYQRMGVSNRQEAIARAAQWGLLADS